MRRRSALSRRRDWRVQQRRCSTRRRPATSSDTYKSVYDGWKWWHVYCYRCHGVDAVGTTNAPNLIDPDRKLSAAEFSKVVLNGIPDKGMQAWDKLLDRKQVSADTSLRSSTDGQGAAAGTAGRSRSEREAVGTACWLAWEMSRGDACVALASGASRALDSL